MNNKMTSGAFHHLEQIPWEKVDGDIQRKVLTLKKLMLVLYSLPAGLVTDSEHFHLHEQAAYILSGHVRMFVDDDVEELKNGSIYLVRSGVKHHIEVLEDSIILDCFSPPREDFLDKNGE